MRGILIVLFLVLIPTSYANSLTLIEDGAKVIKGSRSVTAADDVNMIAKAGRLEKVTRQSLTMSKTDNIQNLIDLAVKEGKVGYVDQFKYIKEYKNLKDGDELLLICLKHSGCNLKSFTEIMHQSPLHVKIAIKHPYMSMSKINQIVGTINENIMNKYFQSSGWKKIEGEVGRNGIDGLFIKRKNGSIHDVMIVESKYNKSGLQHTNNGQQMTKEWVEAKINELKKKYPNNTDYNEIERYVKNDTYRALLWNLKTDDKNIAISLKKVHDKEGRIVLSNIKGREKMKINYNGNQIININKPSNEFHKKIITWYKEEMKNI